MKVRFDIGEYVDMPTPAEIEAILARRDIERRADAAAKKYRRMRLQGYAVGGVLNIGGDTIAIQASGAPAWNGQPVGPTAGFAWAFRRISVSGLTFGSVPDIVNMQRRGSGDNQVWQFNGNNFAYTFSHGEMVLLAGETFALVNQGAFTATGQITLSGDLTQVPQERLGQII